MGEETLAILYDFGIFILVVLIVLAKFRGWIRSSSFLVLSANSKVSERANKEVVCENCRQNYIYEVAVHSNVDVEGKFYDDVVDMQSRANMAAKMDTEQKLKTTIGIVPCPACGWLQENMCDEIKSSRTKFVFAIGLAIAVVLVIKGFSKSTDPESPALYFLAGGIVVGFASLFCSRSIANLIDPNSGHPGEGHSLPARANRSRGELAFLPPSKEGLSRNESQKPEDSIAKEKKRLNETSLSLAKIIFRALVYSAPDPKSLTGDQRQSISDWIYDQYMVLLENGDFESESQKFKYEKPLFAGYLKSRKNCFSESDRIKIFKFCLEVATQNGSKTIKENQRDHLIDISESFGLPHTLCKSLLRDFNVEEPN